jgi:hypothetical protein
MPGSTTMPGRPGACDIAPVRVAFRAENGVGSWDNSTFAAQWLACMLPCRHFAGVLTDAHARLGADVVRYSFIVMDLHHLLLTGLPAHSQFENSGRANFRTCGCAPRELGARRS